jgi:hypothetical protein
MVKTRGNITFVRVFVLATFFLTIVLDLRSETKEIFYVHSVTPPRNDRHRFLPKKTNFTPPLVLLTTKKKQEYSVLHQPQYTGYSKLCRQHFSYPSPALFSGFTMTGKIRGFHPINGPPDEMSSLSATENFKLNPKAIYQSPAGSCTRISNNFLPDVEKSPLLFAALNSSELVFYAPSGTKKKTPVHSSGGAPQLECPDDISTYTDINSCSSFIAGGLNPGFDETEVVTLTWEMFGATSNASPAQGINLIDDYTFDEGATIITYTATGTDGTTSSCTFTVTISDNQVPRLESIPADITVETAPGACAAPVYWIEPTATDNCTAPHLLVKEATHYPGDEFPVGTTTVYYTAYDAMGNPSQTESFTITVKDTEPPVLSLPSDVTLACNDPLPAPWQSLQQLAAAGGSATDNCTIDESSFRLLSEIPSSTVCPYTLTRVYEIADAAGNTITAGHRIVVEGEGETVQPDQEEEVQLKSGMAECTASTGNWNNVSTWSCGQIPTATDNVIIPSDVTVTIDGAAVCNNITIESGGVLNHSGATTLQVNGNWTNNGTFTAETNSTVIFTGTTSPVSISGTNTTIFKNFELDKGAGNILNVNSDIELDGTITFTSGIMQISSGTSVICTHNAGFTIEEDAGMVISGGTFTTGPFSVENEGFIRIDSGALTFGTNSGNGVVIRNSGQLEINGGIVNVAGRLEVSGGTVDISDGTINLNTVGHSSATLGTLDLSLSSVWNMTGGTLNFENPSGAYDVVIKNSSGSKTFGGTINFGDGTSQTYKITSQVPFPGFNVASNTNIILEMLVSSDGNYNFPLVDGAGISIPASVTISGSGYTDASVQIETTGSKHDDNASSTNYLNRYWAITTSGITSPDYDVTVTYAPADIAGTESEIAAGLWTGSLPWGKGGVANSVNNSITFSGITVASADITGITLEPPTVEINNGNASETICNGSSITLNTTVTGDPTFNYSWDPTTDLDLTDPANPIADPSTTTTYEVTVTDGNGFTATDDIDVIVDPQSVGGTASSNQNICNGDVPSDITLSGYTGTIQWQTSPDGSTNWTDISGATGTTLTSTEMGSLIATTYYRAEVTSGVCPPDYSNTVTITVNPLPTLATASQDAEVCDGNPATINLTGLLPNTTFTVEYIINGANQAPVAGLASDASGNSSFSTGNLTTSNNGQILQITGITITSATPNCTGTFAVDAPLSVNTPPAFTACPDSPINLNTEVGVCTAIANYSVTVTGTPAPTYSYTFSGATTTAGSQSGTGSGETFNAGTTTVTVTATNDCGSVDCVFDIIVEDDISPVISNCPFDVTVLSESGDPATCTQAATWAEPTATDNCTPEAGLNWIKSHTPGSSFPLGTTTVTYTATDAAGNTATCAFEVTVVDNTPPTFTPPNPLTVNANGSCDPPNLDPNVTLSKPYNLSDNCTASGSLLSSYTDGARVPTGICDGNYTITRTWTVTDAAANSSSQDQIISVEDNTPPSLNVPPTISIECSDSDHPDNTGWATSTDNCSDVVIDWDDVITPGVCVGRYTITRTWTATDNCGNFTTGTQTIYVGDNEGPSVIYSDIYVDLSIDTLPLHYETLTAFLDDGGSVTDNCSAIDTFYLMEDLAFGLDDVPGYCPDSIQRYYRIFDECGNYTDFTQTVIITDKGNCSVCVNNSSFHVIDFLGDPNATTQITDRRTDKCCDTELPGNVQCIAFNIRLDNDAVGVEVLVNGGAPDFKEWKIDCDSINVSGGIVCIEGGGFHLFTFCKQGNNPNTYTFNSVPGAVVSEDINARVQCGNLLSVEGNISNPRWHSVWPGTYGQYDKYLWNSTQTVNYDTTSYSPLFVPDADAPPVIHYQVCGDLGTSICDGLTYDCAVVEAHVRDSIDIQFNINPDVVCEDIIPTLQPEIYPASDYLIEWFLGYDATGTPVETGPSYTPPGEGQYSIKVTDIDDDGFPCSEKVTNFDIVFDHTGPTVQAPPEPLVLQCNDPSNPQLIQDWLNLATYSYIDADSSLVEGIADNNYSGINMACNEVLTVRFYAEDQCSNNDTTTSTITVIDTIPPTITCPPAASNIPADDNLCEVTELVLNAPTATDDCDTDVDISWKKTGATTGTGTNTVTGPFNVGETLVTYYATDDCGNIDSCIQIVTVIDIQPPNISCPPDITATAEPPGCELEVFTIEDPIVTENCGEYSLTWKKTGATVAADSGNVNNTLFYAGITTVTYYVIDEAGNSDSCSFFVTINDTVPPTIIECPPDITVNADEGLCSAVITVPSPNVEDPCNEIVTITNNSPYKTNDEDASGTYPVGIHEITWTFTDIWENDTTCLQIIEVIDNQAPVLNCPPDFSVFADQYKNYASNVTIPQPTHNDNCDYTLFWGMHGATTDTATVFNDKVFIASPYPQLNVGDNIITYYLVDYNGDTITCSFTITVEAAPVIECPPDTTVYADVSCVNPFDPGIPDLREGGSPIDWTWTMTGAVSGSGGTTGATPMPDNIGVTSFTTDTTWITWTATNVAGSDVCTHWVAVVDTIDPVITLQTPYENCVDPLHWVTYDPNNPNPFFNHVDPNLIKSPSPDYRTFPAGDTSLDLLTLEDNCCDSTEMIIHWRIEFSTTYDPFTGNPISHPDVSGIGQPSERGSDIELWGDGVFFNPITHKIFYWVEDCNGNITDEIEQNIVITPRPEITKESY